MFDVASDLYNDLPTIDFNKYNKLSYAKGNKMKQKDDAKSLFF